MEWWMWAVVAWAIAASVGVLWLAVAVGGARSGAPGEPPADEVDLPWPVEPAPGRPTPSA